jgi:GNAT superfamily N-acetyltransferase
MEIREYDARDTALVGEVVALRNARKALDSPWSHPDTEAWWAHWLTHGWDGDVPRAFVGITEGRVVAAGELTFPTYDNPHWADLGVDVLPAVRRRGYGSALMGRLLDEVRAAGRRSPAMGGWDSVATRGFAAHHGFSPKLVEVSRRHVLADTDWETVGRLRDEAAAHAGDYELLRIAGRTPPDLLPAVAEMTAAINDAPNDELDLEPEVFTPERVEKYEQSTEATSRLFRVIARHRATGTLAGHTVVTVERDRPWIGEQDDTSVVGAHRGHRLGLWLKTEMALWLHEAEPQLATIDTWNAKSNKHMIEVNEALGYQVLGESVYFQTEL